MKKIVLVLLLLLQFLNSNTEFISKQEVHTHTETISGTIYVYEHSHVEASTPLFCEIQKQKHITFYPKQKSPKVIEISSNEIINQIFRPPIF